eukprot:scaffold110473_cov63-Phaeocystis_antarctica.AAC.3
MSPSPPKMGVMVGSPPRAMAPAESPDGFGGGRPGCEGGGPGCESRPGCEGGGPGCESRPGCEGGGPGCESGRPNGGGGGGGGGAGMDFGGEPG